MRRTCVLAILDGWGIGKNDESNPIFTAHPKHIQFMETRFPCGALQASGLAVGMHWDEEGNSEVGHLTLGAGRVFLQHYPKISRAIEDSSFFTNPALAGAFAHARASGGAVHLVGLVGDGVVHSAFAHLAALIAMAKQTECSKLFVHCVTDGRDSAPQSAGAALARLQKELAGKDIGAIASVAGRYYAMDRDKHWDRVAKAYNVLTGLSAETVPTIEDALMRAYAKRLNDEYVEPAATGTPHPIADRDAVIFFNYREDRMRELARAFLDPAFKEFPVKRYNDLYVATMTDYDDAFTGAHAAFRREAVSDPLGKVLAEHGKTQLRVAETEKYAHITYFFNGLTEKPYPNEFRILIPSKNVAHYEDHPEMMASAITDRALIALNEGGFDFILVNYANPDMVAHTGNYNATIKAVETVDAEIGRLLQTTLHGNHVLMVTSDHGNAEVVMNLETGEPETKHDANPVPFYLVAKEFERAETNESFSRMPVVGILSDVAPTILALMGIPKPESMTGQNLLDQLI